MVEKLRFKDVEREKKKHLSVRTYELSLRMFEIGLRLFFFLFVK